jgi:hypothetical protein
LIHADTATFKRPSSLNEPKAAAQDSASEPNYSARVKTAKSNAGQQFDNKPVVSGHSG